MRLARLLQPALWLAYPLLIFFGLKLLEPRYVAALLALLLLARRRREAGRLLAGLTRVDLGVLYCLLGIAALTAVTNSELLLRLYPVAVSLGMLLLFALSLGQPQTMIERLARLREPELPPQGVAYTRRITQLWCAFFVLNGNVALYTALHASRDIWALYNGCIAYVLMGALFAGEWLYRRFALKRPHAA